MFPHPTSRKIARLQAFSRKLLLMRLTPAWELPCTANFPQAIVIKMNFPAKTGPETANSPCFLPVIREYQGQSGRRAPLQPGLDPAELAPQQARMEPRRLELCECGSFAGEDEAAGQFLPRIAGVAGEGDRPKGGGGGLPLSQVTASVMSSHTSSARPASTALAE